MKWLNYHHLLYFWTVAREGTITAACETLSHHVPQRTRIDRAARNGDPVDKTLQMNGRLPAFFRRRIGYTNSPQTDRVAPDFNGIAGNGFCLALNYEGRPFRSIWHRNRQDRHGQTDHDEQCDDPKPPDS